MHLLVRRYKRGREKAAVYIFVDKDGKERGYIIAQEQADGHLDVQAMSDEAAANKITYLIGQKGFIPDGREEVVDQWLVNSSEELGEAPTGGDFRSPIEEELPPGNEVEKY